jgi:hypothetical protein
MNLPEENAHAFLVRIWSEPREIEQARPEWRGMIEHIPSGQRRYVKNLDELAAFIASYLELMGVKLEGYWRLRQWLKQWQMPPKTQR